MPKQNNKKVTKTRLGSASDDNLEKARKLFQSQAPTLQTSSVDSIGAGINQAANNIVQMAMQRRNQQLMTDLYNRELEREQKAVEDQRGRYLKMGWSPEEAETAAYNEQLAQKLLEQRYKQQEEDRKRQFDQGIWQSYYDAELQLITGGRRQPTLNDMAKAQAAANSAMYGQRAPIGGEQIGRSIGANITINDAEEKIPSVTLPDNKSIPEHLRGRTLPGGLGKYNYVQATPEERMTLKALGVSEPEDLLTTTDRRSQSSITATNARFVGPKAQADLLTANLGNQGKTIQNQRDQLGLNTEQTQYDLKRAYLSGQLGLPGFLLQSGVMGQNPAQAFNLYGGENFGKNGNKIFEGFNYGGYIQPPSPYVGKDQTLQDAMSMQKQLPEVSQIAMDRHGGEQARKSLLNLPVTLGSAFEQTGKGLMGFGQNAAGFARGLLDVQEPDPVAQNLLKNNPYYGFGTGGL